MQPQSHVHVCDVLVTYWHIAHADARAHAHYLYIIQACNTARVHDPPNAQSKKPEMLRVDPSRFLSLRGELPRDDGKSEVPAFLEPGGSHRANSYRASSGLRSPRDAGENPGGPKLKL